MPLPPLHADEEAGALRGVPKDVSDQGVDDGREVVLGEGHGGRARGEGALEGPLLLGGEDRPEVEAHGDHLGDVAGLRRARPGPGELRRRQRGARRRDDRVQLAFELPRRLRDPARAGRRAHPVGLQVEGGQRGAQPVREVSDQFAFDGEEVDDPVRHGVERRSGLLQFGRAVRCHPDAEVAGAEGERGALEAPGGAHHPGAEPVGDQHRAAHQADGEQGHHAPRGRDAPGEVGGGHVRLDDRDPLAPQDDGLEVRPAVRGVDGEGLAPPYGPVERLVGGVRAADETAVGQPHGQLVQGAEFRDGLLDVGAPGGEGEHRGEGRGALLGGGGDPVAGLFADEEGERDEERERHHGGDGQGDPGEGTSHGALTSLMPMPRTVWR